MQTKRTLFRDAALYKGIELLNSKRHALEGAHQGRA
jgi:hypothetical protein